MRAPRTAHFSAREFRCPEGGAVPQRYHKNLKRLQFACEKGRTRLGGQPWHVVSGWRSLSYNRKNKGRASKSRHLTGEAIDFYVRAPTNAPKRLTRWLRISKRKRIRVYKMAVVYWVLKDMMDAGEIPKGGLACYPTFVHLDIRGWNARWRRAPKRPANIATYLRRLQAA